DIAYDAIPTSSSPSDTLTRWNDAYCDFSKNGYRLPTDSEWEYAARGKNGANTYTYAGSSNICDVAWYWYNTYGTNCTVNGYYGTNPVAKKTANNLDLCDMSGNVYEWCWNWHNESGDFPKDTPTGNVQSSGGSFRVYRGGYWGNYSFESDCRVSYRGYNNKPNNRNNNIGFRVACKGD
ncbi:MAG: formylglycine-generating enzyme family protein, partial [Dysgonamonadaceae bacterium]|nr:formylglycine-generating enzyme family protein [Dysgonamonadaceae bacterium]